MKLKKPEFPKTPDLIEECAIDITLIIPVLIIILFVVFWII